MNHRDTAALLSLAIAGAAWIIAMRVWPHVPCRRCNGTGRAYQPLGTRAYRLCPACDGSGRRARTAVQIWRLLHGRPPNGGPR